MRAIETTARERSFFFSEIVLNNGADDVRAGASGENNLC